MCVLHAKHQRVLEGLGWHLGLSIPQLGVTIHLLTSVMMVLAVTAIDAFV
jgi:hypothetical protein